MQAPCFHCAKPWACANPGVWLRMIAERIAVQLCLLALAGALAGGCPELVRGQQPSSQAAKPDSGQSNSGQSSSGQAGTQQGQPQQNNGSSAGTPQSAPMTIGDGEDEGAPAEQAPEQQPAQAPAAQSAQPPEAQPVSVPTPPVQQQTVPAAPAVASPQSAEPALAALPPAPPDSSDPRKLVNWECADLLKMANDLKAVVDKTNKDELSIAVVRKAGEIEQMAHKLRDDMRPAMAGKN